MTEHSNRQWNNEEIASHLRSAMDTLTPDVLDRIDLQTPQEIYADRSKVTRLYRRFRTAGIAVAACLCVAVMGAGVTVFQNSRIDSFIGIDVNPSVELSVNRNDKVLKAEALNADAVEILDDMDLKNVDLNIAVNAVIGSMARHGYLEGMDNAILVTVSNKDEEKAAALRQDVVGDIQTSLEEHKLQAVVYDQQTSLTKEIKALAARYDISYGKAYFLQELVDENDLTEKELEEFAGMTMEEISREIADRSYNIRKEDDASPETDASSTAEKVTKPEESTTLAGSSEAAAESMPETAPPATAPSAPATQPVTPPAETTAPAENKEEVTGGKKAKIDYVDYDGGMLNVVFKDKVKWKNPTISVKDENGESYSARITDTGSDSCEISVEGLPGGISCTFTIGGVAVKEGGAYGSVKGYFDTPDIAGDVTEPAPEETQEPETTAAETAEATEPSAPPATPEATAAPEESTAELSTKTAGAGDNLKG